MEANCAVISIALLIVNQRKKLSDATI